MCGGARSVRGAGARHGRAQRRRVRGRRARRRPAAAARSSPAPLRRRRVPARLRTLVAAVARAHEGGIAVGDISGATVLVCPDQHGRLVLGRLSLSQVPAFGPHGQILAPEVVRGEVEASDPSGGRGDRSLRARLHRDRAGGRRAAVCRRRIRERELDGHAHQPPPRIADLRADLPGELSDLVDWLLAKQPAARPRSVADVLAQLDAMHRAASAARTRALRVLIVDDDTARARWLWSLGRRAHAAAHRRDRRRRHRRRAQAQPRPARPRVHRCARCAA